MQPSIRFIYPFIFSVLMARFERSREKRRDTRGGYPNGARKNFRDSRPDRDGRERNNSGRDFSPRNDSRRDIKMTRVTCSSCGAECEVPFKPTSSKPVYYSDCFTKKSSGGSNRSNGNIDVINEKLNKIMKALKIE